MTNVAGCASHPPKQQRYKVQELTITADCGGSNAARVPLWKPPANAR
jgi:hypothetical protein